jgi:hypothetical protein
MTESFGSDVCIVACQQSVPRLEALKKTQTYVGSYAKINIAFVIRKTSVIFVIVNARFDMSHSVMTFFRYAIDG